MDLKPELTIITPVFNGEKYLEQTIVSIVASKIPVHYEYLIVNDGSTDSTSRIIEKYSGSLKVLNQDNGGESSAVNLGLANAKGEFILVVNSDDPLLSVELISQSIRILKNNQNVVVVYPDWQKIDEFGNIKNYIVLPEYSDRLLIGLNWCLPGPGVVFRRSAANQIGGRNTKWKFVGDYDFWLRLSRIGDLQRVPMVLAQWRESINSTSISSRGLTMANERINVISDFLANNLIDNKLAKKARSNSYVLAGRLTFFDSKIPGQKLLFKAFKSRRGWPELLTLPIFAYILLLPLSRYITNLFFTLRRFTH